MLAFLPCEGGSGHATPSKCTKDSPTSPFLPKTGHKISHERSALSVPRGEQPYH